MYRVGLIGLGGMANAHINGLKNIPEIVISAICDVQESALTKFGEQLGVPDGKRFTDFRQLIQDPEVDAVISVTPNIVHAEIMKACIEAGKPFLSEKPFTMTLEEAEEVKASFDKMPVPSMIGFSYRYTPGLPICAGAAAAGQDRQSTELLGSVSSRVGIGSLQRSFSVEV